MVTYSSLPRPDYNWSKNTIPVVLNTDIDQALHTAKINLRITIYYKDYAASPVLLSEWADVSGNVTFDLSGMLDEAMDDEFTPPDPAVSGIFEVANSPVEFKVEYFEYEDDVQVSTGLVNNFNNGGANYLAVKGGVSTSFSYWNFWNGFYYGSAPLYPWMTMNPAKLIADKEQLCPLYFLNDVVNGAQIKIKYSVYWADTALPLATDNSTFTFATAQLHKFYGLLAGWNKLDIDSLLTGVVDAEKATHWTAELTDNSGTRISEIATFYLDAAYRKTKYYLLLQNSLNGFDDLRLMGEAELKVGHDRSVSSMSSTAYNNAVDGVRKSYGTLEQQGKKVNTGYLSPKEINSLRELLLSQRIYEVFSDVNNTRLLPVELTEKTKQLLKTSNYNHGIPIEYQYTFRDRVYTMDPGDRFTGPL